MGSHSLLHIACKDKSQSVDVNTLMEQIGKIAEKTFVDFTVLDLCVGEKSVVYNVEVECFIPEKNRVLYLSTIFCHQRNEGELDGYGNQIICTVTMLTEGYYQHVLFHLANDLLNEYDIYFIADDSNKEMELLTKEKTEAEIKALVA